MTELRHRGAGEQELDEKEIEPEPEIKLDGETASDSDSKTDTGGTQQGTPTDDTPEVLNRALSSLSSRWKNWWVRGILTLAMIAFFFIIIYLGPIVLMMIVMCVQIKCFQEIIMIGYNVYHSYDLPWFRTLSWYFLLCVNYFFYGETVTDYFFTLVQREEPLRILSKYHRFISFALYLTGFCMFVLSLVKKHYRLQFYMFGWTHVTLLIVVTQSHLIIHNLFEGMIWFIVPISCVICNDIMAYMFGFFFGRTPLIKLSPKKTWEGFIGGFFSTVVFGILLSYVMAGYSYFVCPVEFNSDTNRFMVDCEPSDLFQLQEYHIPAVLQSVIGWKTVWMYPFQIHSIALSTFASLIGPFGGFFASGFKRAFKIKDFANTIPGHGGIMDRFDCQYLMATFVNVYIASFIRGPNPSKLIQQFLTLRPDQQIHIFNTLKSHLTERGMLGNGEVRSVSMMTSDHAVPSARLHNSLEKPVKSGWLKKQQKSFVKNWQQKYFVLKGEYLCFYKDEDDSKQQGSLFLARSTVSEVSCSPDDAGKFVFEVIPDQKKSTQDGYILMANTQAEMEEWVKAIKRASGFPSGAVFGQRLADTIAYEKKFGRHMVPILMEKCADFILQNGLNEEGVFRLPGQDTLVKQLKEAFDAGERPSFSRDTDVHTVSSLFKLYLRELPEPVFPWSQYEDCLACENTMSIDEEKGHEELMKQIKLLPRENYNLLSFICRFLYEVQKNSSINKMSVDNLAMVIGVNLLRPKTEEPVALMRGAPQIQKLMTVMISHHEKFFPKANDQPIETKTQRNDLKKVQVTRSSVGWDAAEESISPTGDLSRSRMKYSGASPCSSISDDNMSLHEDYSSGLVDDTESWNAIPRKRTQTMPITNSFIVKNKDDRTASPLNEEIFSGEFWASPNGRKVNLSAGTGHKRTLSELSQHRTSTYDNVPDSQCDCGRSGSGTLDACTMKRDGQQSPSQLKNGASESKNGDSCESLASSLEEMRISKMKLEDRIKSLEKENYDVWKKVVKLNEDLEKERNQRMAQEITLQNMKQSRDDAERRNKHLEKEIQGFMRAMSQAGKKPE